MLIKAIFLFYTLFCCCTNNSPKIICTGTVEEFIDACCDKKQYGASLMNIKIPNVKSGSKTNVDYFNLGINNYSNANASYCVDGTKITLHNDVKNSIYFLTIRANSQDSLLSLKFNSAKVKNIKFIGKGIDHNFYFIIEQETSCNKLYITPYHIVFFSEH